MTVLVAVMQLEVSAALMQVKVSAADNIGNVLVKIREEQP